FEERVLIHKTSGQFAIARRRVGDDGCRQVGRSAVAVPVREQPVAYDLLVEARAALASVPLSQVPVAGTVGCEHLVGEGESSVDVGPELELGVGEDEAALES